MIGIRNIDSSDANEQTYSWLYLFGEDLNDHDKNLFWDRITILTNGYHTKECNITYWFWWILVEEGRINDSKDLEEDYSSKLEIRIDRNPEIDQKSLK